jgi:hypothetical protein
VETDRSRWRLAREMAGGGGGAGRKVAVAAVQFVCTDTVSDNVATAERYGCIQHPSPNL